ncbi:MAG: 2OG-Fe(II) oxygenase [Pseudomonadota bacterium]|nr:2OG-Fe(II) oxygenase [Pseudomonadota bacterium]
MQNIFLGAKKYISEQIEFSKIINTPCEYSIIDNFLPEKVFNEIDLNWPSEVMVPIPETGRTKKYSERKVMLFQSKFLNGLDQFKRNFWILMLNTLISTEVIDACYNKFKNTLDKRISHLGKIGNISSEMLIVSDKNNYSIGPHTDSRSRFISLLLYLSKDSKYQNSGTCFYQPRDITMPVQHLKHHKFDDFNLSKKIKYIPNRLVIFPRTDASYHGVESININDCDRRLIIINIKAPEGAK